MRLFVDYQVQVRCNQLAYITQKMVFFFIDKISILDAQFVQEYAGLLSKSAIVLVFEVETVLENRKPELRHSEDTFYRLASGRCHCIKLLQFFISALLNFGAGAHQIRSKTECAISQ